jgi:hypothetical protein
MVVCSSSVVSPLLFLLLDVKAWGMVAIMTGVHLRSPQFPSHLFIGVTRLESDVVLTHTTHMMMNNTNKLSTIQCCFTHDPKLLDALKNRGYTRLTADPTPGHVAPKRPPVRVLKKVITSD